LAAYQETCRLYRHELKPVGLLETKVVQTIADTNWRLDRICTMENSLFSLGFQEHSDSVPSDDPIIHCALAQAKAVQANADVLLRLSLYEQRLNRTLAQAKAELKELQEARRPKKKAFSNAAAICKMKQAMGEPWQPEDDGFVFSSEELSLWTHRRDLIQQGHKFRLLGCLPESESRQA